MLATLQAEQSVAGAIMTDTKARFWPEIRGFLQAEDFQNATCEAIYTAACKLYDAGEAADAVTIARAAGIDNRAAMELLQTTPTAANVAEYARIVHNGALCRSLAEMGQALTEQAFSGGADPLELATAFSAQLDALSTENNGHDLLSAGDAAELLLEQRGEKATRMMHSFPSLDRFVGGLAPGRLYVVGARPGIGKSAFGIAQAALLAKKYRVLYVSLEMEPQEIAARVIGSFSGASYSKILNGARLTDEQEQAIAEASIRFDSLNLSINRAPTATVAQVGVWAREADAEIVYIDHIGLLRGTDPKQSEYDRITAISGDLKRLARTLRAPIIAETQLNRKTVDESKGNRPKLQHLRSSGALEQDADVVWLLHREDAYLPEEERVEPNQPQNFEIEIAKNRHGRTGRVVLTWYANNNRFVDRNDTGKSTWSLNSWQ